MNYWDKIKIKNTTFTLKLLYQKLSLQISIRLCRLSENYFGGLICNDGVIYKDEVEFLSENWKKRVLVFIPLMMGRKKISKEFFPFLKWALNCPQTLGIIGGVKTSALYIIGWQHKYVLYLDPHTIQSQRLANYSCDRIRLLPVSRLSSSISMGFYFADFQSFASFEKNLLSISTILTLKDSYDVSVKNSILSIL